jgi:hypothetical protein
MDRADNIYNWIPDNDIRIRHNELMQYLFTRVKAMISCDVCKKDLCTKNYAIIKQPLLVTVGYNQTEDDVLIYVCKACLLKMAEPLEG